jgi:hypothetical protein
MSYDPIAKLESKLNPWALFADDALNVDLDAYLDERDSEAFEREWLRVDREISSRGSHGADASIEAIEQEIFLRVSRQTGQHEVASYIADDFCLICRALATGYSDPWLNGLYEAYKRNELPDSSLQPVIGNLPDLI